MKLGGIGVNNNLNIYDIAKASNVSIATVSRVLSGSDKVSDKTKKKVMDVIEATGFKPNAFARGLGLGSMKMVGVLCENVSDLHFSKTVSILERLLRQNGLDTLLYCTGNELAEKKRFIDYLLAKRVDTIILIGSVFKEETDNSHIENAADKVPVIIINGLVQHKGVYCVLCDEKKAMHDNVVNLYNYGCKNIAYIYESLTYSGIQKLEGFKEGLKECGLIYRPELVIKPLKDFTVIKEYIQNILGEFDGVLTSEDIVAIGVCKALDEFKLKVPVIGFNNSILAECATPTLTSVDNMMETVCSTAISILVSLLDKKSNVPDKVVVMPKLIQRETFQIKRGDSD